MIGNGMLDVREAAAFLGLKISTLYVKVHKNQIRYFKPGGGKIFFKKEDLIRYLERNIIETEEAILVDSADFLMKNR